MLVLIGTRASGQDLEQSAQTLKDRLSNNPLTLSGNFSAQLQWNAITGIDRRRDPFNLSMFGSANLNVLGINTPFSIAIADGNTTYNLPSYTFVGISPSYRWAKLHLFRRNMNFSKYTLAGHGFNGVGLELRPGNWRIATMYGTLRKARLEDFGFRHELDPHYRRIGYGAKVGYETKNDHVHLVLFKATDDEESLAILDSNLSNAKENLVLALEWKKSISNLVGIEGEYAYSVYTPDKLFLPRSLRGSDRFFNSLSDINGSTQSNSAFHFDLYFRPDKIGDFSISYERVNPDFTSLGTLQFQNDFEHFTTTYRGKLTQKIGMQARIGIERNNLDGLELESRNRFIASLQFNLPVSENWNNNMSYSNFTQTTRLVDNSDPFQLTDSIFLGSTNHQFATQSSVILNDNNRINGFINHQRANTIEEERISSNTAIVNNAGVSFFRKNEEKQIAWTSALFYSSLLQAAVRSSTLSLSTGLQYEVNDLFNISMKISHQIGRLNGAANGNTLRLGFSGNYKINTMQSLQLRIQWINRASSLRNFREALGHLGYQFRF